MQKRPNSLLENIRPKGGDSHASGSGIRAVSGLSCTRVGGSGRGVEELGPVLAEEEAIVFLYGAADEFEADTEADDAYAGAGEHAP